MSTLAVSPHGSEKVHHAEKVMGTIVTFDIYLSGPVVSTDVEHRLALAVTDLHHIDNLFSTWAPDSAMNQVRREELALEDAPDEIAEVLSLCREWRELSWGWFDPWSMPGGVDPTGFVKGWAAQRARSLLEGPGVTGIIVNAAGDVAVSGSPDADQPFRVGIVNPFATQEIAIVVDVTSALATSGTYERGAHLIDPGTGEAHCAVASASVCGPDLGGADALATALAVGGTSVLVAIDEVDGYEAMVIDLNGVVSCTPGFPISDHTL